MAVIAAFIGIISVLLGLNGSLVWDTPAGPSIVVAALGCFTFSILPFRILKILSFKQLTKRAYGRKMSKTDEQGE